MSMTHFIKIMDSISTSLLFNIIVMVQVQHFIKYLCKVIVIILLILLFLNLLMIII